MDSDGPHPTVLMCSDRAHVIADLGRAFEGLGAEVAAGLLPGEWPRHPPRLVVLDLSNPVVAAGELRLEYQAATRLVALADNESADRLIVALAGGCDDYLFYPLNLNEVGLLWRKMVSAPRHDLTIRDRSDGHLRLEFPSDVRYVGAVVNEVVNACQRMAFAGRRATLNLRVAVGEAVSNAILYGNRADPARRVCVTAELHATVARVTVQDEGEGFDPTGVEDPSLPQNRESIHGRGLFLLRTLADAVLFNEAGNAVTLTLRV